MKKMGCASCGGAMKKMQKGGSAEIVGMPKYGNNPRTSTGAMLKKGGVAKAKFGATVDVQRGYPGKIRSAEAQGYTAVGKREPARTKFAKGGFPDLNKDGKITKADILKGRGVIKRKGGAIKKK